MEQKTPSTQLLANLLKESLSKGQQPILWIESESMSPLLRRGDQVVLEWVAYTQLEAGDIITVWTAEHLLTHRFWGLVNGRLQTRGDRLLELDPLVTSEAFIGRVCLWRREQNGNRQTFNLKEGSGRWLNGHLAQLAQRERQWCAWSAQPGWVWLVRRLVRGWASLSAMVITGLVIKRKYEYLNQ